MRAATVAEADIEPADPERLDTDAIESAEAEPVESELLPPGVFAVLKLDKPIKAHGEQITRIELREPDVGTLDGIKTGGKEGFNLGYVAIIISRLGDIPPSSAKQIPLRKLVAVKESSSRVFSACPSEPRRARGAGRVLLEVPPVRARTHDRAGAFAMAQRHP